MPASVQEVADRAQQLEGLVVNRDIAQGWREGYPVLKREVVHLQKPISALGIGTASFASNMQPVCTSGSCRAK